jgi:hypothetical protein
MTPSCLHHHHHPLPQWHQCGGTKGSCKEPGRVCVDAAWAANICQPGYRCMRFSGTMWQCVP